MVTLGAPHLNLWPLHLRTNEVWVLGSLTCRGMMGSQLKPELLDAAGAPEAAPSSGCAPGAATLVATNFASS